jgi:hypothetical protein
MTWDKKKNWLNREENSQLIESIVLFKCPPFKQEIEYSVLLVALWEEFYIYLSGGVPRTCRLEKKTQA